MNRSMILALVAVAAAGGKLFVAHQPESAAPFSDPPVGLQATTPGTQQTGHVNISGTLRSGTLNVTNGDSAAKAISGIATGSGGTIAGYFRADSGTGRGVYASATATSGSAFGGQFLSSSTSGTGILGWAKAVNGLTFGGSFQSDSDTGVGVLGVASAVSGITVGGDFRSASPNGTAVQGIESAVNGTTYAGLFRSYSNTGIAVAGWAHATSGTNIGGWFETNGTAGKGLVAKATSTTGTNYGIYAETASNGGYGIYAKSPIRGGQFEATGTSGTGVFGVASSETGLTYGGQFRSASTGGYAVLGWETATTGTTYGAFFQCDSPTGRGLYATATSTTGPNYGVTGYSSAGASGYGVYSLGRFAATGTKAFRIDHPFDPENKYLSHYCSEGPEPLNVYSGTVVTDDRGYASVQLPDYFADINKDPRYQLTVIDSSDDFVIAKITKEINANKFQLRANKPNVKVCWRVEATRNDLWVRKYGAPVETDKVDPEKGTYQHPELYGKPKERGTFYVEPGKDPMKTDAPAESQRSKR